MENGYWTKFEAWHVKPSERIPHGIRNSLTLHDHSNRRVLGYDNAHAVKPKRRKFGARRRQWDHRQERQITEPYEFESPAQLLEDFWSDVDRILNEES